MKSSPEKTVGAKNTGPTPDQKPTWEEVSMGAVITEGGSGVRYQTGDWRSERPVIDMPKCIQCFFCWVYCPDAAITTENQLVQGVDYFHCKGCGICAAECPVKCIAMVDESELAVSGTANDGQPAAAGTEQAKIGKGV